MRKYTTTELQAAFHKDALLQLTPGDCHPIAPSWQRSADNDADLRHSVVAKPDTFALHRATRAHRSRIIGQWIVAGGKALIRVARRIHERERERQHRRMLRETLRRLDDRTLQDIGLHRSQFR